jgi:4-amino-4-deoxy-L-arabinose transferase-like glycosyltransferase
MALIAIAVASGVSTLSDPELVAQIETVAVAPFSHRLFIHAGGEVWFQPLAVFPAALLLAMGVPHDLALIAPPLLAGNALVWLTYRLGLSLAQSPTASAAAAAMLLITPGFVTFAHTAGAGLLMAAAILCWCLAVVDYLQRACVSVLVAGATALAMSAYTQPAGVWSVLVFLVLGAAALRRAGNAWRPMLIALSVVGVLLAPIGIWVALNPEAYQDTLGRWAIHAAHVRNPIDGAVAFSRWHVVARRVSDYWNYFSPSFLFGSGQLFALWAVVLVPLGLWAATKRMTTRLWFVVAAFVAAPIAAVMLDVTRAAASVLTLLPLGAILAMHGLVAAAELGRPGQVITAIALVVVLAAQLTGLLK